MNKPLAALLGTVVALPLARADVVSVTGQVTHIAAPPSVESGVLAVAQQSFVFLERSDVQFDGVVNRINPPIGFSNDITNPASQFFSGRVDSHMVHFDNFGLADIDPSSGRITFDGTILALIYVNTRLDDSDPALGAPGTVYPFGLANRGFSGFDMIRLESPDTLFFNLVNGGAMDQFRVLTTPVPTPSAMGALTIGLAGLGARRRRNH